MTDSDFLWVEHDGDTWRVLSTGIVSGDKTLCHLASLTRKQWNSDRPLMIADLVPTSKLVRRVATPATVAADPKDSRIEDLEHALRLAVSAIKDLLPGATHIPANIGLINEALVTARIVLKGDPDA